MNKPHLPSFDAPPFEFAALGTISLDAFDETSFGEGLPATTQAMPGQVTTQYRIVVKRNDNLYRVLSILNTIFSIIAVLLIVAIFGMVFYGLVTITEVAEMVSRVQEHNELQALSDK